MTKEERHRLATKWGAARYSEAQKSAKKLSYRKVYVEGVALFGKDAMPNRSVLQERVMAGEIGTSPNRRGRPETVDECITEQLVLFNAVLRESKNCCVQINCDHPVQNPRYGHGPHTQVYSRGWGVEREEDRPLV
jgi:hypothetical protein